MRPIPLTILALLIATFAGASPAFGSCYCARDFVENEFAKAASIFIGQVIEVSGPREVATESAVEKYYVTKLFVWDRWKGAQGLYVEVLSELPENSCVAYPPMRVGETHLVFADSVRVKSASPILQGIVTTCTLTTRMVGPGPEYKVEVGALTSIFALDKLTKPATPRRMPAFGRQQIGKGFCLVC